jgi:hypothetical protein
MHDTAYELGSHFFQSYFASGPIKILDIGSQNVNGTLRDCAPAGSLYVGADITPGAGVDVVFGDRHSLPFADGLDLLSDRSHVGGCGFPPQDPM